MGSNPSTSVLTIGPSHHYILLTLYCTRYLYTLLYALIVMLPSVRTTATGDSFHVNIFNVFVISRRFNVLNILYTLFIQAWTFQRLG